MKNKRAKNMGPYHHSPMVQRDSLLPCYFHFFTGVCRGGGARRPCKYFLEQVMVNFVTFSIPKVSLERKKVKIFLTIALPTEMFG